MITKSASIALLALLSTSQGLRISQFAAPNASALAAPAQNATAAVQEEPPKDKTQLQTDAEVEIEKKHKRKHKKHHHKKAQAEEDAFQGVFEETLSKTDQTPACTSLGCHTKGVNEGKPKKEVVYPIKDHDSDIKDSLKHLKEQERKHGEWVIPKEDVQVENEEQSVPACTSNGCKTETAAPHKVPKKDQYPKDYFVPNFGMDKDVASSLKHTGDLEEKYGPWNIDTKKKKEDPPVQYHDHGMDHDIKDSIKHLNDQESVHGAWHLPEEALQTKNEVHMKSDPPCNSHECFEMVPAGTPKPKWPRDYFVPDFGKDEDIADSEKNEAKAAAKLGHTWEPKIDPETDKFKVPTATANAKISTAQVHQSSDPACTSLGCTELETAGKIIPKLQTLKDYGVDTDLVGSQSGDPAAALAQAKSVLESLSWNPDKDDDGKWMASTPVTKLATPKKEEEPKQAKAQKKAPEPKKAEKDNTALQVQNEIHQKSDPACTSIECETRHSNPSKREDPVYFNDPKAPLDDDIQGTQKHMNDAEAKHGHWDYLADVQVQNEVNLKQKTHQKTHQKSRLQTRAEKTAEFASMRAAMMSNWGTK